MLNVIFALAHKDLEQYLQSRLENVTIVSSILYKEAILDQLERYGNIDLIILRETLQGSIPPADLIYKIRIASPKTRIIFIATDRLIGDELLSNLVNYGIYDIMVGKEINVPDLIKLVYNPNTFVDAEKYQCSNLSSSNQQKRVTQPIIQPEQKPSGFFSNLPFGKKKKNINEPEHVFETEIKSTPESDSYKGGVYIPPPDTKTPNEVLNNQNNLVHNHTTVNEYERNYSINQHVNQSHSIPVPKDSMVTHPSPSTPVAPVPYTVSQEPVPSPRTKTKEKFLEFSDEIEDDSFSNPITTSIKKEQMPIPSPVPVQPIPTVQPNTDYSHVEPIKPHQTIHQSTPNINEKQPIPQPSYQPQYPYTNNETSFNESNPNEYNTYDRFESREQPIGELRNNRGKYEPIGKQKIISFMSGVEGVGCSTIAFNTAINLSSQLVTKKQYPKVMFLELNDRFSSIAFTYQLDYAEIGLDRALKLISSNNYQSLQNSIIGIEQVLATTKKDDRMFKNYKKFPLSLDFMFFSKSYTERKISDIDESALKELFMYFIVQEGYDYIVVDVGSNIHTTLAEITLNLSTQIYGVLSQNSSAIASLLHSKNLIEKKKIPINSKFEVILNQYNNKVRPNLKEIESWIGRNLDYVINYTPDCINYDFNGEPIIFGKNKDIKNALDSIKNSII